MELKEFQDSLERFELLDETQPKEYMPPHPATVVCDYICNSFYASNGHRGLETVLKEGGVQIFNVFNGPLSSIDYGDDLLAQNHDWGRWLKNLVSHKFPEGRTDSFFRRMREDKGYDQTACVNILIEYLRPFVQNRETMQDWIERINLIIDKMQPLQHDAYIFLKAHMLLFLIALYTHLGKNAAVDEMASEFVQYAGKIQEVSRRDELLVLFCNRQIVSKTDLFQFDEAGEYYRLLERYFQSQWNTSEDFFAGFLVQTEQDVFPETTMVQWGRCMGSYMQLLTKIIRFVADQSVRENAKSHAEAVLSSAFKHFSSPRDISFCHQNVSDLLVELGEYENAMMHLCQSFGEEEIPGTFAEQADYILNRTSSAETRFQFMHYVLMMHRAIAAGNQLGDILLDRLIVTCQPTSYLYAPLKGNPYPEGVILWHLAASLAHRDAYKELSKELFDAAWAAMKGEEFIFTTIGMAIRAEELDFGLQGRLPGKAEKWHKEADDYLKKEYPAYQQKYLNNPFAKTAETGYNMLKNIYGRMPY